MVPSETGARSWYSATRSMSEKIAARYLASRASNTSSTGLVRPSYAKYRISRATPPYNWVVIRSQTNASSGVSVRNLRRQYGRCPMMFPPGA